MSNKFRRDYNRAMREYYRVGLRVNKALESNGYYYNNTVFSSIPAKIMGRFIFCNERENEDIIFAVTPMGVFKYIAHEVPDARRPAYYFCGHYIPQDFKEDFSHYTNLYGKPYVVK